jgi:hypothetical protein
MGGKTEFVRGRALSRHPSRAPAPGVRGRPLPNAFIKHHYVDFHDGKFLNRPINEFSVNDLKTALDLYNIKWVIVWSDQAKNALRRAPELARPAAVFKYLDVFEILREPDFFCKKIKNPVNYTGIRLRINEESKSQKPRRKTKKTPGF